MSIMEQNQTPQPPIQQPQPPVTPIAPVATPAALAPHKKSARTLWALILLVGPTALLILTFIAFAIVNWVAGASTSAGGDASIGHTLANVVLFIFGTIGVISWLPGIIVGIILLATKPAAPRQ